MSFTEEARRIKSGLEKHEAEALKSLKEAYVDLEQQQHIKCRDMYGLKKPLSPEEECNTNYIEFSPYEKSDNFKLVRVRRYRADYPQAQDGSKYFLVSPITIGSGANGSIFIGFSLEISFQVNKGNTTRETPRFGFVQQPEKQPYFPLPLDEQRNFGSATVDFKFDFTSVFKVKRIDFPRTCAEMEKAHTYPPNLTAAKFADEQVWFAYIQVENKPVDSDLTMLMIAPLYRGRPLSVLVDSPLSLSHGKMLALFCKITYRVFSMQSNGFLVRDLKLDNILFENQSIKIIDTDSARPFVVDPFLDSAALTGEYAPPEYSTLMRNNEHISKSLIGERSSISHGMNDFNFSCDQIEAPFWDRLHGLYFSTSSTTDFFVNINRIKSEDVFNGDVYSLGVMFMMLLCGTNFTKAMKTYSEDIIRIRSSPTNILANGFTNVGQVLQYALHQYDLVSVLPFKSSLSKTGVNYGVFDQKIRELISSMLTPVSTSRTNICDVLFKLYSLLQVSSPEVNIFTPGFFDEVSACKTDLGSAEFVSAAAAT